MGSPLPAVLVGLVQPQGTSSGTGLLPGPILVSRDQEDLEGGEVGHPFMSVCLSRVPLMLLEVGEW